VLLLQQPPGHDVASHTHWPLALQACPGIAQVAQVAPLVPQDVAVSEE